MHFSGQIHIFAYLKNIVFDLGRVVFAQDPAKSSDHFKQFFSYVSLTPIPQFWTDYDLGVSSFDDVAAALAEYRGVEVEYAAAMIREAISRQETIQPTGALIADLKAAGYKLYVLSNMSREFIDFLREQPVYRHFDGEVVSCEEGVCKPEREIYQILLSRYGLNPSESLFIDDRKENIEAAEREGIVGFHFNRNDIDATIEELRSKFKM